MYRQRLFAHPSRPNAVVAGSIAQLFDESGGIFGFSNYDSRFAGVLGLNSHNAVLRPLREGSRVISGTLLGRVGNTEPGKAPVTVQLRTGDQPMVVETAGGAIRANPGTAEHPDAVVTGEPDAVIGHSQGEIAAAHIAGALTLDDAAKVVALRAQAIAALAGTGAMAAIPLPADQVETGPALSIALRHVMRNALMSTLSIFGLQIGYLLSGAVVTETVFSIPGVGTLLVEGIGARDYPIVQGVTLFFAVGVVITNFIVDMLSVALDPRVKL